MKIKLILSYIVPIAILFYGCTTQPVAQDEASIEAPITFPERAKDMVIYEVNIRQYTPEGTFEAFETHISRIKEMGVDILWLMPLQPIGVEKRKGLLGSGYSIRDYTGINPEHGTLENLKSLISTAHELDMLVILDWVANHTAWDHKWITDSPEYYTKDSLGNIIPPRPDWFDIADLNFDNNDMRMEMINAMKYWITEVDMDGFRCDAAWGVPMEFWNRAKDTLDLAKDVFMLAEADQPKMHKDAFHMTYGWEFHHIMNQIGKGEYTADSIEKFISKDLERYGEKAFRMNFTTNHDENSWNGTVFERYGEGAKTFAVLAFTIQGMPLIYSGQEAGLDKRLKFFEKDEIDWSTLPLEDFYTKLSDFKKQNKAIWNGEYGAVSERVNVDNTENIYAFIRVKEDNKVIVLLNLSDQEQSFTIENHDAVGKYKDLFTGNEMEIYAGESILLDPWEYFVSSNLLN